jgi:uncharacterized protein
VITGASSGLGAAMAKEFVSRGAIVVVTARSSHKLRELTMQLGGSSSFDVMDVTSVEEVQACVGRIIARYGRIDTWINNAGYGIFEAFGDAGLDHLEGMMDVNYMGTVRCTKSVLPYMLKARKGHIVNIASMAGKIGSAKSSGYSASKHAVLGFTNSLRQELAGSGVALTAVNPGPIDTPFFDKADPSGSYVKNVKWFMLKPEKVAAKVADAVVKQRKELDLPLTASIGVKLYQLFPRLLDGAASRLLNKK